MDIFFATTGRNNAMICLSTMMRRAILSLAAAGLLFLTAPGWAEDKPATTTTATAAATDDKKPDADPHKSPDITGSTNGSDAGPDTKGGVGSADYPVVDLKDKDGKATGKGVSLPVDVEKMASSLDKTRNGLNMLWTCLAGFLVFFMQAGFALVETGFTRAKNAAHTMGMNMMVFCIGFIGYYICGFAFMFGGVHASASGNLTQLGGSGILDHYLIQFGGGPASKDAATMPWHILGGKGF